MADSPEETLSLARTAAGAVRSLNHATLGGQGLAQPADAYELIGELALAAAGNSYSPALSAVPRPDSLATASNASLCWITPSAASRSAIPVMPVWGGTTSVR